jgi:hypothetical protein
VAALGPANWWTLPARVGRTRAVPSS